MKPYRKIQRIRKIEAQAVELQNRMDQLRREWATLIVEVQTDSPELWKADCDSRGLVTDPDWYGVLC